MKQNTAETFKLALAITIADVWVLLVYFAIATVLYGTTDWLDDWVVINLLVIGYRMMSLQPLYLYLMLKIFRQGLHAFSQGLVMSLSCVSSLVSLFAIGFILPISTGEVHYTEWIPLAFEFFTDFIFEKRQSILIPAMFGVLLLSPILVYQARRLLFDGVQVGG